MTIFDRTMQLLSRSLDLRGARQQVIAIIPITNQPYRGPVRITSQFAIDRKGRVFLGQRKKRSQQKQEYHFFHKWGSFKA